MVPSSGLTEDEIDRIVDAAPSSTEQSDEKRQRAGRAAQQRRGAALHQRARRATSAPRWSTPAIITQVRDDIAYLRDLIDGSGDAIAIRDALQQLETERLQDRRIDVRLPGRRQHRRSRRHRRSPSRRQQTPGLSFRRELGRNLGSRCVAPFASGARTSSFPIRHEESRLPGRARTRLTLRGRVPRRTIPSHRGTRPSPFGS